MWLLLQSTFPENLLRFSAECENMTVATVKTVILSICWANLRHFGTLMPALKERLTPSCSSNFHIELNTTCFKTWSCILLRIQMNPECVSQLLELEALFIECVNITQVGEGSAFRSHTTTHSIWGHFWCVTHPVNDLKSVLHVNKCYLLNYSRVQRSLWKWPLLFIYLSVQRALFLYTLYIGGWILSNNIRE